MDQIIETVIANTRATGNREAGKEILAVANNHYYGNGSLAGQFGRFRKVMEARGKVAPRKAERRPFGYKFCNPIGFLHDRQSPVVI